MNGFSVSADSLSSDGDGISSDFLARHTTDRSLTEYSQFIRYSDALRSYTASAVDPVLSIPVRENFVPTHLQWRCASDPSVDDASPGRTNRDPMPGVVMRPCTPSSDNPTYDDVLPGEAVAVGDAAKIITDIDNLVVSASGSVCSRDTDGREGVHATLVRLLDECCAEPGVVGEAAEVIPNAGSSVGSSSGSPRFRDAGLEVLVRQYRETVTALEQELWQRLDEERRLLQSATAQFSGEDTRNTIPMLEIGYSSLTLLRCSLLRVDDEIVQNCTLVEQVSSGQTRQDQALAQSPIETRQDQVLAQSPVETRQEEVVPPAVAEPKQACEHYQRRCYVRFSCCINYFACHRCHNNSGTCDNTEAKALNATHLKCAQCKVVQVINENSQRCSNCSTVFSEYFCAKCKHFTSMNKNPFHCEKCGICRIFKDRSFHCDICNVCLDKRLEGKHTCRPDSGHDECCICLEDAFSGCQILPCSHKVHRECAIAMIQNGVRTCPVCRTSLYTPAVRG